MNIPATLNGYPVIGSQLHKECATVMMKGDGQHIVATWWPELGKGWSWGHYFPDSIYTMDDVTKDFTETSFRNSRR